MNEWDGKTERRKDVLEIIFELKSLSERFDNELGASNGSHEGSVKRHLRKIQTDVEEMKKVIIGDGKDEGIVSKIQQNSRELREHKNWDMWLFVFIGGGQLLGLYKMFNP